MELLEALDQRDQRAPPELLVHPEVMAPLVQQEQPGQRDQREQPELSLEQPGQLTVMQVLILTTIQPSQYSPHQLISQLETIFICSYVDPVEAVALVVCPEEEELPLPVGEVGEEPVIH